MDIVSAIDALVRLEQSLVTADGISIKNVYPYIPPRSSSLPDMPCIFNEWSLDRIEWTMDYEEPFQYYTVHAQLFVRDADLNVAARIASSFMPAFVQAFTDDSLLEGTVSNLTFRGRLALLPWSGPVYPGLDIFISLEMLN